MFSQHPIIPLIFAVITAVLLIKQSIIKKRISKLKLISIITIIAVVTFILVFYNELEKEGSWLQKMKQEYVNWFLLGVDLAIGALLFTTVDFSYAQIKFNQELTKSLDESKLYVVLDKKDRVKEISTRLSELLNVTIKDVYNKNFFDVLEIKYRIIGFNGEECLKKDVLAYYDGYSKKVTMDSKAKIQIILEDDNAKSSELTFHETPIFHSENYKGRILMGDLVDEASLIGMEKELNEAKTELNLLRSRFTTILYKTEEGIFFNDLANGYIWCNDVLVKKLSLNGNSVDLKTFYKQIHPDDLPLYEEKMKSLPDDYEIKYRFYNGSQYLYVVEVGNKIKIGRNIELSGIMKVLDNYGFQKTDSPLDNIGNESDLLARLKQFEDENRIFQTVVFDVASIPEINEKFGRGVGNTVLAQYVLGVIKQNFVTNEQIYRVKGLEFVALITEYRKMDMLKNNLYNNEKILHSHSKYLNDEIEIEVFMGISTSDDTPSHKDSLKNAYQALKYASNPNFNSNFAYYKDIK